MTLDLTNIPCFGIAGNFTGHLEQAGEAGDFRNIKTKEESAPKAVFPTYIPGAKSPVPEFLSVFPFDSQKIVFPAGQKDLQIEPECAIIFKVDWQNEKIISFLPEFFGASNDCSIRREAAKKISLKKNWGASCKGLSDNLISVDSFSPEGNISRYSIACYLKRGNSCFEYGEESPVSGYSYFYDKLLSWLVETFNSQADEGPAENIRLYLNCAGNPEKILVSVGATRYTEFGKTNFLKGGDQSLVFLFPSDKYKKEEILELIKTESPIPEDVSVLKQEIII